MPPRHVLSLFMSLPLIMQLVILALTGKSDERCVALARARLRQKVHQRATLALLHATSDEADDMILHCGRFREVIIHGTYL